MHRVLEHIGLLGYLSRDYHGWDMLYYHDAAGD